MTIMMPPQRHAVVNQYNPAWTAMTGPGLVPTAIPAELAPRHASYPQFVHPGASNTDFSMFQDWDRGAGSDYAVAGSEYALPDGLLHQDLIDDGDGGQVFNQMPNLDPRYI